MKTVYKLVDDAIQSDLVSDDYVLLNNETFEQPEDGIYQPFSFVNGKIVGTTKEVWEQNAKNSNTSKTVGELVADLAQQLAVSQINQTKTNAVLLQQNAALTKQVAALQAEKETTNG
ncbi:hypothetical protein [Leuconostoc mesenteroides]|uniref:hypothetical protein n=1 Tax=Leuconostoc mesenteroides TaxID=1245 RepID=UPI000B9D5827|nr:hypothetical protein [Leuconostoc mesenteroides]BAX73096.1 hypothetical protein LEMES_01653 [Leuconostoc mesenteroides]